MVSAGHDTDYDILLSASSAKLTTKQARGPLIKASSLPCPPSPHACGPQSKEQSMRCCSLKLRRSPVDTYLHRGMEWGRGGGLGERGWTRACGEGEARGEGGGGRDTGAHTKLASHKRSVQKRLQYRKRYTCTIVVSISLPPLALTTLPPLCPWPRTTSKSRTCPAQEVGRIYTRGWAKGQVACTCKGPACRSRTCPAQRWGEYMRGRAQGQLRAKLCAKVGLMSCPVCSLPSKRSRTAP